MQQPLNYVKHVIVFYIFLSARYMSRLKRDINQQDLKIVDLHFMKFK